MINSRHCLLLILLGTLNNLRVDGYILCHCDTVQCRATQVQECKAEFYCFSVYRLNLLVNRSAKVVQTVDEYSISRGCVTTDLLTMCSKETRKQAKMNKISLITQCCRDAWCNSEKVPRLSYKIEPTDNNYEHDVNDNAKFDKLVNDVSVYHDDDTISMNYHSSKSNEKRSNQYQKQFHQATIRSEKFSSRANMSNYDNHHAHQSIQLILHKIIYFLLNNPIYVAIGTSLVFIAVLILSLSMLAYKKRQIQYSTYFVHPNYKCKPNDNDFSNLLNSTSANQISAQLYTQVKLNNPSVESPEAKEMNRNELNIFDSAKCSNFQLLKQFYPNLEDDSELSLNTECKPNQSRLSTPISSNINQHLVVESQKSTGSSSAATQLVKTSNCNHPLTLNWIKNHQQQMQPNSIQCKIKSNNPFSHFDNKIAEMVPSKDKSGQSKRGQNLWQKFVNRQAYQLTAIDRWSEDQSKHTMSSTKSSDMFKSSAPTEYSNSLNGLNVHIQNMYEANSSANSATSPLTKQTTNQFLCSMMSAQHSNPFAHPTTHKPTAKRLNHQNVPPFINFDPHMFNLKRQRGTGKTSSGEDNKTVDSESSDLNQTWQYRSLDEDKSLDNGTHHNILKNNCKYQWKCNHDRRNLISLTTFRKAVNDQFEGQSPVDLVTPYAQFELTSERGTHNVC